MIYYKLLPISVDRLVKSTDHLFRASNNQLCSATASNPKLLLQDNVYNLLSELGDLAGLLFEQQPYAEKDNIHIDYDKYSQRPFWPCLNLILQGQGILRWYRPKGLGEIRTAGGNIYMAWDKENYGEIVDEWTEGKVALVRTDIPHNAFNFDNETRLSISIRWDTRYSWNETVDWFDKKFIPYVNKY